MRVRRILHRLLLVSAASGGLLWSPTPAAEGSEIGSRPYHLTRLGPLQGNRLNNKGEVIGTVEREHPAGWEMFAAIYHSYGERAGAVDAILGPDSVGTNGLLLNDRGQAVIENYNALIDPTAPWTLFWDGSEARGIEPEGRQVYFNATAINNAGTVVGTTHAPGSGIEQPAQWSDGRLTPLSDWPPLRFGTPTAINDRGQVVGWAIDLQPDPFDFSAPPTDRRAVLWEDGKEVDLGTFGVDGFAEILDVNNAGQVLGIAYGSDGYSRTILWQDGQMTALDLPGWPRAINSAGDVFGVGWGDDWAEVPFIYADGSLVLLQDLLPPEFDYEFAAYTDFNDLGQILGFGFDWDTPWDRESFLLTPGSMEAPAPVISNSTTIPEPTTLAMLGLIGAASLARGAYREAKGRLRRRGA